MAASIREYFGKNLTRIMAELKDRGVLQKHIAKKLGVASAQMSHWKNGQVPDIDTCQLLLEVLGEYMPLDPEDLFGNPQNELARRAARAGYDLVKRS